jgi:hypothetical protein
VRPKAGGRGVLEERERISFEKRGRVSVASGLLIPRTYADGEEADDANTVIEGRAIVAES